MGNDGGSIPTRRELVKEAARDLSQTQVKEIQTEQQEHYWSTCALSHQPLSLPVVSDALGTLYNKDAILDHLLSAGQEDKQGLEARGEAFKDRLRSLRDVIEVIVQTEADNKKWVCPVTGKELGPGVKAIYLVPCGHAFSESAIKEMPGDSCLQVHTTRSLVYWTMYNLTRYSVTNRTSQTMSYLYFRCYKQTRTGSSSESRSSKSKASLIR